MVDHDMDHDYAAEEWDPAMYREAVPEAQHLDKKISLGAPGNTAILSGMVGMGNACEQVGWLRVSACRDCGHEVRFSQSSCGRIECPRCHKTWARRCSERVGARVMGAMFAGVVKHHPRHVTFELDSLDWKEAKRKAAAIGMTGGVLVLHPWRIKKSFLAMMEIMAERCSINRYDVVRESAFGMDALEYSPHCHAVGYGRLVDIEKGSGDYLYRMIRKLNTQESVERSMGYLLGHTMIPATEKGSAVRYFGICSPQKLAPSWTGTCQAALTCPCCGGPVGQWVTKTTFEVTEITRFIALGWHVITKSDRGALPPITPLSAGRQPLTPGLCT